MQSCRFFLALLFMFFESFVLFVRPDVGDFCNSSTPHPYPNCSTNESSVMKNTTSSSLGVLCNDVNTEECLLQHYIEEKYQKTGIKLSRIEVRDELYDRLLQLGKRYLKAQKNQDYFSYVMMWEKYDKEKLSEEYMKWFLRRWFLRKFFPVSKERLKKKAFTWLISHELPQEEETRNDTSLLVIVVLFPVAIAISLLIYFHRRRISILFSRVMKRKQRRNERAVHFSNVEERVDYSAAEDSGQSVSDDRGKSSEEKLLLEEQQCISKRAAPDVNELVGEDDQSGSKNLQTQRVRAEVYGEPESSLLESSRPLLAFKDANKREHLKIKYNPNIRETTLNTENLEFDNDDESTKESLQPVFTDVEQVENWSIKETCLDGSPPKDIVLTVSRTWTIAEKTLECSEDSELVQKNFDTKPSTSETLHKTEEQVFSNVIEADILNIEETFLDSEPHQHLVLKIETKCTIEEKTLESSEEDQKNVEIKPSTSETQNKTAKLEKDFGGSTEL